MRSLYRVGLVGLLLLVVLAGVSAQDKRVALVIGNGAYQTGTVPPLANPPNDAADMAQTLRSMGFAVTEVVDGTREDMEIAISRFGRELYDAEVGLFFYAGHGVQVNGSNYLVPVDARLDSAEVIPYRTVAADQVLAFMESANTTLNLFFLDACRDNPLPQTSRSVARGLAVVGRRPPETMIVYATAAGDTAADGDGRNSPFTAALVKHLPTPNLDVYDLFRNVSSEVQTLTAGAQRPEQYGNVSVRYSLVGSAEVASAAPQPRAVEPTPSEPEPQEASFDARPDEQVAAGISLTQVPHPERAGVTIPTFVFDDDSYPANARGLGDLFVELGRKHPEDAQLNKMLRRYRPGAAATWTVMGTLTGITGTALGIMTFLYSGSDSQAVLAGSLSLGAGALGFGLTVINARRLSRLPQEIIDYYNQTYAE